MDQNRTDKQSMPNRSSNMEQAEGSRETVRDNERMSGSEEMRNRESSSRDLGSSSDRAMFSGREEAEERTGASDHGIGMGPAERGMGSSGERNLGGGSQGANSGGITNRELDREECEQQQLPERGRSQSESER